VRKTSVYLHDREAGRLRELSRLTGRTQAQIVREAIAAYEPATPDRRFAILANEDRGPGDSVADHDEGELLEGFGG